MDLPVADLLHSWTQVSQELTVSGPVLLWTLSIVLTSLAIGFYLGRCFSWYHNRFRIHRQRQQMLTTLAKMAASTDQLSHDVDSHSSELQDVEKTVSKIDARDLERAQLQLMGQIERALDSNRRLEHDLVCARYMMEAQAVELDRTRQEARTDALSGLSNRKGFDEYLEYALARYHGKGKPFALILCDVDHFKWINDTHGHVAGDQVVMRLGEALKKEVRPNDFVARYGGDEFALILMGLDAANASHVAERIRQGIEAHNFDVGVHGSRVAVTFSMGLAVPRPGDTATGLVERADKALYRSKEQGRNRLHVDVTAGASEESLADQTPVAALPDGRGEAADAGEEAAEREEPTGQPGEDFEAMQRPVPDAGALIDSG